MCHSEHRNEVKRGRYLTHPNAWFLLTKLNFDREEIQKVFDIITAYLL